MAGYLCTGSVLIVLLAHTDAIASPAYATLIAEITIFTAIAPLTSAQALSCGFALSAATWGPSSTSISSRPPN